MKSRTTARFRKAYDNLPQDIRKQARDAYQLFIQTPIIQAFGSSRFTQLGESILHESLAHIER